MLTRGVRHRLDGDAPACFLVSGGIDSSLILKLATAQMDRSAVVCYTARFDGSSHDLAMARRLCAELGVELREVHVAHPTRETIEEATWAIEIPSKAQVEIAMLCLPLARRIAADGFKVCLSGEAADELFGGYGSMCIRGAAASSAQWGTLRRAYVDKMARGNFIRTNKAFMAYGVECRLPFMDLGLVESALAWSKRQCPPRKRLLREAVTGLLPTAIINRTKATFQGESGMARACATLIGAPVCTYNAIVRKQFGSLVKA